MQRQSFLKARELLPSQLPAVEFLAGVHGLSDVDRAGQPASGPLKKLFFDDKSKENG